MIPLKMKSNATECSNHITIILVVHASNILLKILIKRIESKVATSTYIGADKYGFGKWRRTRDDISVIICLGERSLKHSKDLYKSFVDFEKAFNRVNWPKLKEVLDPVQIDKRNRELTKNWYIEQTMVPRIDGKDSKVAKIGRVVRQGCPMLPQEFSIYTEAFKNKSYGESKDGVKVGKRIVQTVRFADDQAMVANTTAGLPRIMECLPKTSEDGIKINLKKTK
jgi:Reverse transcriptase (RNA-dependent DNA polymerase)